MLPGSTPTASKSGMRTSSPTHCRVWSARTSTRCTTGMSSIRWCASREPSPTTRFGECHDERRQAKEYLPILHHAARDGEGTVDNALRVLLASGTPLSAPAVIALARKSSELPAATRWTCSSRSWPNATNATRIELGDDGVARPAAARRLTGAASREQRVRRYADDVGVPVGIHRDPAVPAVRRVRRRDSRGIHGAVEQLIVNLVLPVGSSFRTQ